MKILLADDEAPARDRLRRLLEDLTPAPESIWEASNGLEALRLYLRCQPDIVFLDIRMPVLDGLACARELARLPECPAVVFTTAYDEYAVEAFDAAACDYLLKPIRPERLVRAVEKSRRFNLSQWQRLGRELASTESVRRQLCVHEQGEVRLVEVAEVRYFYAELKFTLVRTGRDRLWISEPLKALEEEFADQFVRAHRSALVAVRQVERLDRIEGAGMALKLRGVPERIEVSRRHLPEVRERLRGRGLPC